LNVLNVLLRWLDVLSVDFLLLDGLDVVGGHVMLNGLDIGGRYDVLLYVLDVLGGQDVMLFLMSVHILLRWVLVTVGLVIWDRLMIRDRLVICDRLVIYDRLVILHRRRLIISSRTGK
jgi:hypothetical protein